MVETSRYVMHQTYGSGLRIVPIAAPHLREEEVINHVAADLAKLSDAVARPMLVIDFTSVEYMASLFIGKLVAFQKRVIESKGRVVLCGIRPAIREIFKITQLDKVFAIYPDQQQAIKSFEGKVFGKP